MATRIFEYTITIDGKDIPLPPDNSSPSNVTVVNDRIYVDGKEWKDGKWQTTLRALWHQLF